MGFYALYFYPFCGLFKKYGPFPLVSSRYKIGAEFGIVGHGRWQVSSEGGDLCVSARIFDTKKEQV